MANDTLILTSVSTGIIFLLTATVVTLHTKAFFIRRRNANGSLDFPDLYKCEDGTASEDSELEYRATVKKCGTVLFMLALVGFSVVHVDAIIQSLPPSSFPDQSTAAEAWLRTVNWVLVLLLTLCVVLTHSPNDVYRAAVCGAFIAFLNSILSVAHALTLGFHKNAAAQYNPEKFVHTSGTLHLGLVVTEFVAGLAIFVTFLTFPRRPELYTETGRVVDREHTVSAICHYSLHWCTSILNLVTAKETVQLDDLPNPAYAVRAKIVHQVFLSSNHGGPLWRRILLTNLTAFLLQWSLTLLQSAMQFVPQLSMYNLLRQLELRQAGDGTTNFSLIAWCTALSVGLLLNEWVQSWLYWIVFAKIAAPIRAQLSALIFAKALRRKNTKALEKGRASRETKADATTGGSSEGSILESSASDDAADDEAAAKKFTQATINLVGVDASRVADFCSLNCLLVNSIFKICISIAFLIYLIGWRALFAGVLSFALTTPLTTFITKRYSVAQKALMALRDEKLGVVTEVLQGIRGIKFAAAELAWEQKIIFVRDRELGVLWRLFVSATLLEFVGLLGPLLLSSVSLAVYVYFNMQLTPSIAFTTLALFSSLEATVGLLPLSITELVEAKVSTDRIGDYLGASEKKQNVSYAEEISFRDASVAWPRESHDKANHTDNQFVLSRVNITFPRGELTLISGKTGAGKSLLLASLIGESELLAGIIKMPKSRDWSTRHDNAATHETWMVPGSLAFVAQIPWIENMSIKGNILFTLPMDKSRYEATLWACSLEHDLELLPDGDETEIGANGINLSGGQRWRVALARALYSRAEILVLDDVFSAVDAHVGAWILENALMGPLAQGRTRILATHHVSLVAPKASYTVRLSDGTVTAAGRIAGDLIELSERRSPDVDDGQNVKSIILKIDTDETEPMQRMSKVNRESMTGVQGKTGKKAENTKAQAFIQEEQRKTGAISVQIFWTYFEASGGLSLWALCLFGFFAARFIMFYRSWWIKVWTSSYSTESPVDALSNLSPNNDILVYQSSESFLSGELGIINNGDSTRYYLLVYFALSIASCLANTLKELYISTLVIHGSRTLFAKMTYTILRMPLRWIDTVPVGRILNRFTADFNSLDSRMAHDLGSMISSAVQVAVIIVAGFLISPLVVILGVVLLVFAVWIARRYLRAARVVKRLDSVTKSPVFEQFGSALIGLSTIRAFGNAQAYMEKMYGLIDGYTTTSWNLWLFNRWLSFNMGLIGVIATVAVIILIVSMKSIDAALAGLALSFTLEFSVALNWTLRRYANVELIMNAVERVHEYTDLTTEPNDGVDVAAAWPSEGRLLVRDLVVGYDEDSPPVLKGVTFEARAKQRIGIVGRTGAGKSSLMLAIFRFLDPRSGSISIDGIDISKIKLYDLRSRLSIIPQDPGLFAGTIRSNLDPLDIYDDIKLHEALRRAHLTQTPGLITGQSSERTPSSSNSPTNTNPNTNIFSNLSSPIGEGGFNLSQGQRQLLCLARALLSQPKLMILDEATSAVDMQTDTLIQRTLREEFANTTLIVIAHRLSTVADFDRILVLSDGVVEEFGTPGELLARKGAYWRMVGESGGGEAKGEGEAADVGGRGA